MDNDWKDKLRERLGDYSVTEPEGLWEGIEQGLSGKPRRSMLPVWLLSGAAAAAAVALVVFLKPATDMPEFLPDGAAMLAEAADTASVVTPPVFVAENTVTGVPVPVRSRRSLPAETAPAAEPETEPENLPVSVLETEPETGTIPESLLPDTDEAVTVVPESADPLASIDIQEVDSPVSRKGGFSISLYQEGGQDASEQSRGYGMVNTGGAITRSVGGGNDPDTEGIVRMLSANRASTFEARHGAPVRIGIKAAWPMTSCLSLVSGLTWTGLTSEFEESAGDAGTFIRQDLGYLGVPLRLEAGINPWKGLWLVAGAGGMVEKGLLGTSRTYSTIGSHTESMDNQNLDMGGLLWSVGASAGAEYRFNRFIGLYLTPGVEYHFANASPVQSAYTEKPLHWNFSAGVRFSFGR